jgi:hypothetical protein
MLAFGVQVGAHGQTITFNMLKKMIASRAYKDSIINARKYYKGAQIPAQFSGTEYESYRSPDSSNTIELVYRDSGIICIVWAKNLNLLHSIISAGRTDGFVKATVAPTDPNTMAYIKGKYLLTFNDKYNKMFAGNVGLAKNYQIFNFPVKPN